MSKALLLLITVAFLCTTAATAVAENEYKNSASNVRSTSSERVLLYAEPSRKSKVLAELNDGAYAFIMGNDEKWAHVDIGPFIGLDGYVERSQIVIKEEDTEAYFKTYGIMPVYSVIPSEGEEDSPIFHSIGKESEIRGVLTKGVLVQVAGFIEEYAIVKMGQDCEGYMLATELMPTEYVPSELTSLPDAKRAEYLTEDHTVMVYRYPADAYAMEPAAVGDCIHVIADLGNWLQIDFNYFVVFVKADSVQIHE